MSQYADAAEAIAAVDVASVPADPGGAVRQVVLGTVLVEPVLESLRRLAQQHTVVSALESATCARCGGDAVRIVRGYPTSESVTSSEAGEVVLGGCVIGPDDPDWACRGCGHQW